MTKKQCGIGLIGFILAVILAGFFGINPPSFSANASSAPEARILVKISASTSDAEASDLDKKFGDSLENTIPEINLRVLHVPASIQSEIIAKLKKLRQVEYAEPDAIAHAFLVPNDTYFSDQWGMNTIDAPDAWDHADGHGVPIAILDTGIDYTHSDLKDKVIVNKDFTSGKTALDKNGHGTHVAGIAAAITNNARGVAGVGISSKLMNVKVLADNGSGYYSWIANGIIWATNNGAKVVNMSLGGSAGSQALEDAVNYAWDHGVVVVAAAGNSATTSPSYPAYYNHVIAVAATDSTNTRASFSNFGSWVDVAAPGVNILSTYPRVGRTDRYAWMSGTSMASPYVSGLAALVWSTDFGTSNQAVRDRIESTTDPLPDVSVGTGEINAAHAVFSAP